MRSSVEIVLDGSYLSKQILVTNRHSKGET